ncbi:WYL domain-containing protein [Endozoicomonas sp.]|uniref:WYL domain-containing protein n=1 Tax=Endozoicomonas sp. TaxID=1892382 RepID=UPI0028873735|nr:WYL domain-containing protein [Endozoicomonas sp.]
METQVELRLKQIDFYLMFWGKVGRSDLMRHNDIAIATASRTLKAYREQYPKNMSFDVSQRSYIASDSFKVRFDHNPDSALRHLAYGIEERQLSSFKYGPAVVQEFMATLDAEITATITTALVQQRGIEINYISASSEAGKRNVIPQHIFSSQGGWYFRAYDQARKSYRNYKFSRVLSAEKQKLYDSKALPQDESWNTSITLTLAPHQKHPHPEALRMDLGHRQTSVKHCNQCCYGRFCAI